VGETKKVVIVTGGGKGIGSEYCLALAQKGYRVVIADIDQVAVDSTEKKLSALGYEVKGIQVDVTDEQSVKGMVQQAVDTFGRVDGLVNNAAIYAVLQKKPFIEIGEEEFKRVLNVNIWGMFNCCKAVFPEMKKAGGGRIVNISSSTVFNGVPFFAHYVSSKAGVIGLTRALAKELGEQGITINAVSPGLTATETNSNYPEGYFETQAAMRSIKRIQVPSDLTGAVTFLISDESGFITGQTLVVDGGVCFN